MMAKTHNRQPNSNRLFSKNGREYQLSIWDNDGYFNYSLSLVLGADHYESLERGNMDKSMVPDLEAWVRSLIKGI